MGYYLFAVFLSLTLINNIRFNFLFIKSAKWDQFEANKILFGVNSTYDENLYTLKLEAPSEELKRKADRIAREIESEKTSNLHLAEVSLLLVFWSLREIWTTFLFFHRNVGNLYLQNLKDWMKKQSILL